MNLNENKQHRFASCKQAHVTTVSRDAVCYLKSQLYTERDNTFLIRFKILL
jgi:hypothetical protein